MKKKIIQITSGRGPAECAWVVSQVLKKIIQEAQQQGLSHRIIHREPGDENGTLKTATVELTGDRSEAFVDTWLGTIQWTGQSEFRKFHKRKSWFVGINLLEPGLESFILNEADIRYEFTRSGGPGGQHVNKVSTAVRAIHVPSGEVAFSSGGRSQFQNRTEARAKLINRLEERLKIDIERKAREEWHNHEGLSRGNPVRVFTGSDFKSNYKPTKYREKGRRGDKWKFKEE